MIFTAFCFCEKVQRRILMTT